MVETTLEQRFREAFTSHYGAIYSYCARRIGLDEAADVTADAFTVAWRRVGDLPAEPDTRPWLYGVARRQLANHRRTEKRVTRLRAKIGGLGVGAGDPASSASDAVTVRAALAHMSRLDREVLRLAAWEDLGPKEIAGVLGISESAAAVRLHRARQRLARALSGGER